MLSEPITNNHDTQCAEELGASPRDTRIAEAPNEI